MSWQRRHVLATDDWSRDEIEQVLSTTGAMVEVLGRPIRRTPALRGRTVILFFAESSTRTRVSFELAAKALSADVTNITASGSSVEFLRRLESGLQEFHGVRLGRSPLNRGLRDGHL